MARRYYRKYSPKQKRDGNGKWTSGPAGAGKSKTIKKKSVTKSSASAAGRANRNAARIASGTGGAPQKRLSRGEAYQKRLAAEKSAKRKSNIKKGAIGLAAVGAVGFAAYKGNQAANKPLSYDRNSSVKPGVNVGPVSFRPGVSAGMKPGSVRVKTPSNIVDANGVQIGDKYEVQRFTSKDFAQRKGMRADDSRHNKKLTFVPAMDVAAENERLKATLDARKNFTRNSRIAPIPEGTTRASAMSHKPYGPEMTPGRKSAQARLRDRFERERAAPASAPVTAASPAGMAGGENILSQGPTVPVSGKGASLPSRRDVVEAVGAVAAVTAASKTIVDSVSPSHGSNPEANAARVRELNLRDSLTAEQHHIAKMIPSDFVSGPIHGPKKDTRPPHKRRAVPITDPIGTPTVTGVSTVKGEAPPNKSAVKPKVNPAGNPIATPKTADFASKVEAYDREIATKDDLIWEAKQAQAKIDKKNSIRKAQMKSLGQLDGREISADAVAAKAKFGIDKEGFALKSDGTRNKSMIRKGNKPLVNDPLPELVAELSQKLEGQKLLEKDKKSSAKLLAEALTAEDIFYNNLMDMKDAGKKLSPGENRYLYHSNKGDAVRARLEYSKLDPRTDAQKAKDAAAAAKRQTSRANSGLNKAKSKAAKADPKKA